MKAKDVKEKKLFTYKGNVYQWIKMSECWVKLADKDGNIIPPQEIPIEIILNQADVVLGDKTDE